MAGGRGHIRYTGNRSRYACGGTANIRMKLRRIVSSDPNPHSRAMRFTPAVG
jgi:hypothetical protein